MNRGMEIAAEVADSRPLHDRRAGRQRRQRAHGRALPAARAGPASEHRASVGTERTSATSMGPVPDPQRRAAGPDGERTAADLRCSQDGADRRRSATEPAPGDRRRGGRRRRAGRAARPGRPAHPPARARPRGRRDRRDRHRAAAALGGFTAVHAMANTDPVADTAGVVEQVWRLGPRGRPGRRRSRSARSPSGSAASGWPSSARWPTPPPGCGSSPTTGTASPTPR